MIRDSKDSTHKWILRFFKLRPILYYKTEFSFLWQDNSCGLCRVQQLRQTLSPRVFQVTHCDIDDALDFVVQGQQLAANFSKIVSVQPHLLRTFEKILTICRCQHNPSCDFPKHILHW